MLGIIEGSEQHPNLKFPRARKFGCRPHPKPSIKCLISWYYVVDLLLRWTDVCRNLLTNSRGATYLEAHVSGVEVEGGSFVLPSRHARMYRA